MLKESFYRAVSVITCFLAGYALMRISDALGLVAWVKSFF